MGNVAELQDADFESKVIKSGKPVLIDFWAIWCQPCKAISPMVEELAGEYAGKIDFYKVDTDRNKANAGKYGVRGIPTLILFKDGKVVDQVVGAVPKSRLQDLLKKV